MKKIICALLYILSFFVAVAIFTGIKIYSFGVKAMAVRSDCIIILGCRVYGTLPSPFLNARLDEGVRLYSQGFGQYIIVSGGRGNGELITEAEAMKRYLLSRGIDESKIIIEDDSISTVQNIKFSKQKMDEYNLKTAVIVSNKYHLKRASIMAADKKIRASYSGVFVRDYYGREIFGFLREIPAVIKYVIFK
ncbi:MAG TPA: YdcF family protein [Clostridiaceae bacterium]|nr:YdcF family protein [Clostridiaceae bacterium]